MPDMYSAKSPGLAGALRADSPRTQDSVVSVLENTVKDVTQLLSDYCDQVQKLAGPFPSDPQPPSDEGQIRPIHVNQRLWDINHTLRNAMSAARNAHDHLRNSF